MANAIIESVTKRVADMQQNEGLQLPKGYSATNALQSAWLELSDNSKGKSLLEKTTPESQAKALLGMVIQGLSPAKHQVYFIPYGQELTLTRSYFGSLAILQRLDNVSKVWAEVIRDGDLWDVRSEDGRLAVDWQPKVEALDNDIVAAYAVIRDTDGVDTYTLMTRKQIDQSWSHSKNHKVQQEFGDQMAKRTVLNRAAKFFVNSSSDNDLLLGAINDTTENEYDDEQTERRDVTTGSSIDKLINEAPKAAPRVAKKPAPKQIDNSNEVITNANSTSGANRTPAAETNLFSQEPPIQADQG